MRTHVRSNLLDMWSLVNDLTTWSVFLIRVLLLTLCEKHVSSLRKVRVPNLGTPVIII
jgi:hypothetical protein